MRMRDHKVQMHYWMLSGMYDAIKLWCISGCSMWLGCAVGIW